MIEATVTHRTRSETEHTASSLLDILLNRLVFNNTIPYLPPSALLNLASTSQSFRSLIYHAPGTFRHLDLTNVKAAHFDIEQIDNGGQVWRNVQLDENITEEDFYSGPLRGIFTTLYRRNILQDVQTLVLDGLSVTADLCHAIINDSAYNVRILSIRNVKNLNHRRLCGSLQYSCRSSRPEGTPTLKAVYVFGAKDTQKREGEAWWGKKGGMISKHFPDEWAHCMLACEGIIAFDAVLCQGSRHRNSPVFNASSNSAPAVATHALPPCSGCGKSPEGLTDMLRTSKPLLAPPPLLSSSIRAATTPHQATPFVPRCFDCIRERYCTCCHKWWCEDCHTLPSATQADNFVVIGEDAGTIENMVSAITLPKPKPRVSKSCWECGNNCASCIEKTQRTCRKCCGGYCTIHNEGSSSVFCDWCVSRGRGLGRL